MKYLNHILDFKKIKNSQIFKRVFLYVSSMPFGFPVDITQKNNDRIVMKFGGRARPKEDLDHTFVPKIPKFLETPAPVEVCDPQALAGFHTFYGSSLPAFQQWLPSIAISI